MSDTRYSLMKEAYELVKGYQNTYWLFKELGNKEITDSAFFEYTGAKGLFDKLFGIDYYDARDIFEMTEAPF